MSSSGHGISRGEAGCVVMYANPVATVTMPAREPRSKPRLIAWGEEFIESSNDEVTVEKTQVARAETHSRSSSEDKDVYIDGRRESTGTDSAEPFNASVAPDHGRRRVWTASLPLPQATKRPMLTLGEGARHGMKVFPNPNNWWSSEIFDCANNVDICMWGCLLPCYLLYHASRAASGVNLSRNGHYAARPPLRMRCFSYLKTLFHVLCCSLGHIFLRRKIRRLLGIEGTWKNDCIVVCLCGSCASCQEARELRQLGIKIGRTRRKLDSRKLPAFMVNRLRRKTILQYNPAKVITV